MTPEQALPEFERRAVKPIECLQRGWELIKDQYWLFLGIALVGALIGGAVPLQILMGPMMCGVYLSLLKKQAGEPFEFGTLFKGFDYFVDGLVASLFHTIPMIIIIVPFYIFIFSAQIMMAMSGGRNGDPNPAAVAAYLSGLLIGLPIMLFLLLIVSIGFVFTYPLIVDRGLSGVNAVKLSFKAAMANFIPLFGLLLLNGLLTLAGALFCGVGAYFVLPITYAAMAVAYLQVFGAAPRAALYTPPPPPSFN
jgi:hypothetical protein